MSHSVLRIVWVSIRDDREKTIAFQEFALGQRIYTLRPGGSGPEDYDGGFSIAHEAQIESWFERWEERHPEDCAAVPKESTE